MSFIHGKNTGVLWAEFDLSNYLNEASTPLETEASETTTFGEGSKQYIPGLGDATVSLSGLFDTNADGLGQVQDRMGESGGDALTVGQGGLTPGGPATLVSCITSSRETTSAAADVVAMSAEFASNGVYGLGHVLAGLETITASKSGPALDNAAQTTGGLRVNWHVTENAHDAGVEFLVQHSVDNSVWVDVGAWTSTASTVGSHEATFSGPIEDYLRVEITAPGSGAITYAVAAARL